MQVAVKWKYRTVSVWTSIDQELNNLKIKNLFNNDIMKICKKCTVRLANGAAMKIIHLKKRTMRSKHYIHMTLFGTDTYNIKKIYRKKPQKNNQY